MQFAAILAVIMLVSSTFERVQIELGSYSLGVAHIVGLALLPLFFWRRPDVTAIRTAVLAFLGLVVACALPALVVDSASGRIGYVLQIALNSYILVVAYALFRHLDQSSMKQTVRWCTGLLLAVALVQVVVAPEISESEGQRVAGLVRPVGLFEESTWLALVAAMLFCVALALRLKITATILLLLVVAIFTRSAAVIPAGALLLLIPAIRTRRWTRVLLVLAPMAFAVWFSVTSIVADAETSEDSTSLQSRASDISIVRLANDGQLLPWGGRVLQVYDVGRSRLVPGTSNVLPFDLLWKFGVGGIVIFVAWAVLVMWVLPRRSRGSWASARSAPLLFGLAMVPAVVQLNNAFGRVWLWVFVALLLAVTTTVAETGEEDNASGAMITAA